MKSLADQFNPENYYSLSLSLKKPIVVAGEKQRGRRFEVSRSYPCRVQQVPYAPNVGNFYWVILEHEEPYDVLLDSRLEYEYLI